MLRVEIGKIHGIRLGSSIRGELLGNGDNSRNLGLPNFKENKMTVIDQRDIDAQNWGAMKYKEYTDGVKTDSSWLLVGFGVFVFGVLALVGTLVVLAPIIW